MIIICHHSGEKEMIIHICRTSRAQGDRYDVTNSLCQHILVQQQAKQTMLVA
jgi:hypothetical protein